MKKLIPFTLERWQQGDCTPKTADGSELTDLVYQPTEKNDYPLCGIRDGVRQTWKENGIYWKEKPTNGNNLMLEVDCEVVYVSIYREESGNCFAEVRALENCLIKHPSFIKEIKVEL
jgi:hypothetical protein